MILYVFHNGGRLEHNTWFLSNITTYPQEERSWCMGWSYSEAMELAKQFWNPIGGWQPYPYVLERVS